MDTANQWTPDRIATARAIVTRLEEIQRARKLSDRQLVDEYPDLGSTKTWRQRLLGSRWDGLNAERTLRRLQRIGTVLDGGVPNATFFRDLPFAQEVIARVGQLERSVTDRRILVCLAPNGCGKTSVARWCVAQARSTRAYCRLLTTSRKTIHIANRISHALGSDDDARNAPDAENRLIAQLTGTPKTVFLDQAHEGGPALMHLLRALVDETPSRFVYLGYDTAFRRVQSATTDALIEAQAFMGRALKPIFDVYKAGTSSRDVAIYLQRSADLSPSAAGSVAARIASVLQRTANLRLLDDAIQAARAGHDDDEAEADAIVSQVYALSGLKPQGAKLGEEEA